MDLDGSPGCLCVSGYTGPQCQDNIDECALPSPPCDHICTNTPTSYTCSCLQGFVLHTDKKSCLKETGETFVSRGDWRLFLSAFL